MCVGLLTLLVESEGRNLSRFLPSASKSFPFLYPEKTQQNRKTLGKTPGTETSPSFPAGFAGGHVDLQVRFSSDLVLELAVGALQDVDGGFVDMNPQRCGATAHVSGE